MSLVAGATALLAAATLTQPLGTGAGAPGAFAATQPSTPGVQAPWTWPLRPHPEVVRSFNPPEDRWLAGHRGVDLLASGPGASFVSPADGVVRFAGRVAGKEVVVVEHRGGLRSTFEPASSALPLGTPVRRGQDVGVVRATPGHCEPATCLHWGVLRGEVYLDPLALLGPQRVRLLPLG